MLVKLQLNPLIRRRRGVSPVPQFVPATPRIGLILQIAVVTAPASGFVYLGQLLFAAIAFYGSLGLLLGYYAVRSRPLEWTTLVVGCIPMLMLLRPVFYHNSISVIFAGTLCVWAIFRAQELEFLFRNNAAKMLLLAAFVYWWLSVLYTGFYATNMRVFELGLGACCTFLLGRFRSHLSAALWGVGLSTVFIVLGLWKYGTERLGTAEVGPYSLGHPQLVGMAMSLLLVLCLADGGRWLFLHEPPRWRYFVAVTAVGIMLLSTSRTSWLLAASGIMVLVFTKGQRKYLMPAVMVLALGMVAVIASSRGNVVMKYFDKATSSKRTWNQRTTGRLDQYAAFPELFWESPVYGYGPGSAGSVYKTDGEVLVMHSIYLHVGIELGAIGLAVLFSIYAVLLYRASNHRRLTSEVVPLIGALSFCVDGMAHNSFNPLMGVFVGLALTDTSAFRAARPVTLGALREQPEAVWSES